MARHVRAAHCAAPGQGLEPRSRRSERRILPIERTRIAVRRRTALYRPRDSNPHHRGSEPRASSSWARAAGPPRGLEPRSPRYEGGVLPVELPGRGVRGELRAEEGDAGPPILLQAPPWAPRA